MRTIIIAAIFCSILTAPSVGAIARHQHSVVVHRVSHPALSSPSVNQVSKEIESLNITGKQFEVLAMAKTIGDKYGLGLSLMGIAWQESKAGLVGPVGDVKAGFGYRSYGICQVKLRTARKMIEKYPELRKYSADGFSTDEELLAYLITNQRFNLDVAAHVLLSLKDSGLNWSQMVEAYNLGHYTAHPARWRYTRSVAKNMHSKPISSVAKIVTDDGSKKHITRPRVTVSTSVELHKFLDFDSAENVCYHKSLPATCEAYNYGISVRYS